MSFDRPPRLDRPGSHKRVQVLVSQLAELVKDMTDEQLELSMEEARKACIEAYQHIEDAYTAYLAPSHRYFAFERALNLRRLQAAHPNVPISN